jgi:hypothetical protein
MNPTPQSPSLVPPRGAKRTQPWVSEISNLQFDIPRFPSPGPSPESTRLNPEPSIAPNRPKRGRTPVRLLSCSSIRRSPSRQGLAMSQKLNAREAPNGPIPLHKSFTYNILYHEKCPRNRPVLPHSDRSVRMTSRANRRRVRARGPSSHRSCNSCNTEWSARADPTDCGVEAWPVR